MNFKYLDELIHSGKEEIILDSDIILKEGDERINLDIDNMTIDGNGHTIDAQNLTELFYSTAKNITLKDITIKNSLGAIYNEEGEISIMNSRFVQNESKTNGGAVLNYKGKMSIKASEFIENSANLGGAINNYRAILTVEDCIFTKNHAKHYGGAIYSDGNDFNLIASRLNQNTASIGGAIYVNMGEANIIESTLCQNSARVGGAIHNWNILNIKESAIDQNTDVKQQKNAGRIFEKTGIVRAECLHLRRMRQKQTQSHHQNERNCPNDRNGQRSVIEECLHPAGEAARFDLFDDLVFDRDREHRHKKK